MPDEMLPMLPPPNIHTWVIEAPTVEAAIGQCECIDRYGLSPQSVQYYILRQPTSGFLGFGKRPALVEVWGYITMQTFSYLRAFDPPNETFPIMTSETPLKPEARFGKMGVKMIHTVEDADPAKVSAFEIWVSDPTDNRQHNLILLSEYAYNDDATYKYLALKGKPLVARPESSTHLITKSLVVVVDVTSVKYGRDSAIPESYFESIIVNLSAYEAAE